MSKDEQVKATELAPKDVAAQKGAVAVEEKAAEKAGVSNELLDNEHQNREPKNEFEQKNQKVTDAERNSAQKESNLTTKQRVAKADEPAKLAEKDVNGTADIATAISEGFKRSKEDSFALVGEEGIEHRFSVVKNAQGEVMLRENESGTLSKVQLESIEEKEASIQGQEVEEV